MPRVARDPSFSRAFGQRLRDALEAQPQGLADIAKALGYRDDTTLRAAMAGRTALALNRLARLAAWTQAQGEPVDLNWLITGKKPAPGPGGRALSTAQVSAIRLLARALPAGAAKRGAPVSHRTRRARNSD
jgi:hypothetical protein